MPKLFMYDENAGTMSVVGDSSKDKKCMVTEATHRFLEEFNGVTEYTELDAHKAVADDQRYLRAASQEFGHMLFALGDILYGLEQKFGNGPYAAELQQFFNSLKK